SLYLSHCLTVSGHPLGVQVVGWRSHCRGLDVRTLSLSLSFPLSLILSLSLRLPHHGLSLSLSPPPCLCILLILPSSSCRFRLFVSVPFTHSFPADTKQWLISCTAASTHDGSQEQRGRGREHRRNEERAR